MTKSWILTAVAMTVFATTLAGAANVVTEQRALPPTDPVPIIGGMPNPLVSYDNVIAMKEVLGFRPLVLPPSSRYTLTDHIIIDKTTAHMIYKDSSVKNNDELTVRTARRDVVKMANISGYYVSGWDTQTISQSVVDIAEASPCSYAASWSHGDYIFSVSARETTRPLFLQDVQTLVMQSELLFN